MAFVAENSTKHTRLIRPRPTNPNPNPNPNPRPKSHLSKPTSSTLTTTNNASSSIGVSTKMSKFTSMAFNKLGCGGLPEASAPEIIRSAAEWEAKKVRKQKRRKKKKTKSVEVVSDVFCAPPGIGFSSDDTAFVDCVESRTKTPLAPTKLKKHSGNTRRNATNSRPYHPLGHHFHRGLTEKMISKDRLHFEDWLDGYDQFGEWRLDVENMSYEELLDLSDKIGYVGTGLREDKIFRCLRKARLPDLESFPLLPPVARDWKCSICQDEYEANDEIGKLYCGHIYHIGCIRPWLRQKNSCPICKVAAAAEN